MIRAVHSEWIKLTTLRSSLVVGAVAFLLPVVVSAAYTGFADAEGLDASDVFGAARSTTGFTLLLVGVLGVLSVTTEYGYSTIRPTFAATPRRPRVVAAKALVIAGTAATLTAASLAVALAASAVVGSGRDLDLDLFGLDELLPVCIGLVVFAPVAAVLGSGFGWILKATPAAVAALILWPTLVEGLVSGVLSLLGVDDAIRWMPYEAGTTLYDEVVEEGPFGRVSGGVYFALFVLVVAAVGTALAARRDA